MSAGSGLTINITAGWLIAVAPAQIAAMNGVVVSASVTRYVWVSSTGSVSFTATSASPGGEVVCLGRMTSDGSGVTAVSNDGRTSLARFTALRTFEIGNGALVIDTETGEMILGGGLEFASESHTLTGTLALTNASAPIQRIQCAAGQKVLLPDPSTVGLGRVIEIVNDNAAAGATITVRDDGDTTTIGTVEAEYARRFIPSFAGTGWRTGEVDIIDPP